jgi:Icc-related predicted phosphoesterase
MNILHFSDLHGKLPPIHSKRRYADTIVVLSGDICDNYPDQTFTPGYFKDGEFHESNWEQWSFRKIDTVKEKELQEGWIQTELIPHLMKNNIVLDRVIILKGNHDFCSFEKFFNNALDMGARTITVDGIKFGMVTGVLPYHNEWNDEVSEDVLAERIKLIDTDIDILVTHCPPRNIRDMGYGERIGSSSLYNSVFGYEPYFTKIRYHLFGHAHGQYGVDKHEFDGRKVRFVNAAENRMELDVNPEEW